MTIAAALLALCEAFSTAATATTPYLASKNSRFLSPTLMSIQRAATTGGGTVWGAKLLGPANANRNDFLGDGSSTNYDTNIPYVALSNNNWIVKIDKSTRTGTVTVTVGSNTVTGSGSQFLTELAVGKEIVVNGEKKTITSITSATVLTTDSNFVAAAAGVSCFLVDDILVPTTDFTVANNGGNARITMGAAAKAPLNAKISVHFVTPVSLYTYATATTTFAKRELPGGYDVLWYVSDATGSPSATNIYIEAIIGE